MGFALFIADGDKMLACCWRYVQSMQRKFLTVFPLKKSACFPAV
jgi:hypothetical protein